MCFLSTCSHLQQVTLMHVVQCFQAVAKALNYGFLLSSVVSRRATELRSVVRVAYGREVNANR